MTMELREWERGASLTERRERLLVLLLQGECAIRYLRKYTRLFGSGSGKPGVMVTARWRGGNHLLLRRTVRLQPNTQPRAERQICYE